MPLGSTIKLQSISPSKASSFCLPIVRGAWSQLWINWGGSQRVGTEFIMPTELDDHMEFTENSHATVIYQLDHTFYRSLKIHTEGSCKYITIYCTMGYSVKLTSIQSPSTTMQVDRKKGNNSHRSPLATASQSSCGKKPYPLMKHLRRDWIWDQIAGENIGCHTRCTFLSADCCNGWVTVICWNRQGLWDC